jgi:signal peptidase II
MLGRGLVAAALVAALDQASKLALLRHFNEAGCAPHREAVTPFLNLVLACNNGMSFGILNRTGLNSLVFAVVAGVIVVVLLLWLRRVQASLLAVAIGCIIGGAIGNVIDRLVPARGAVIDFLDFHIGTWHWPAFNLADSAICLGVAAMLLDGILVRRGELQAKGRGDLSS